MRNERDQVRQRLSGSGAGLDQEVVAGFDGPGHRPGHLVLSAAALPAHPGHGTVEQFNDELLAGRPRGLTCHCFSHC